jgi:hypothetical protein
MYLTKDHNSLTKVNEITSCICGSFFNVINIWLSIGIFISLRNFICFCIFKIKNTGYQASR